MIMATSIKIVPYVCLLLVIQFLGTESNIGVNYGTLADNLPPPTQVAQFLLNSTIINRVRLFDADPDVLQAFAHTGIAITVTVPNAQIPQLTNLSFAQGWVKANISPYIHSTNIIRILVGNEVLATANKLLISNLVPAMQTLHTALVGESLDRMIQVSTPHSLGILSSSDPPSSGRFREGYDVHVLRPLLSFLRAINSPFLVSPYPYFGSSNDTLNYAIFRPNPGVFDNTTNLNYTNMFDAQLDAIFCAMSALGYDDVDIVIAETGWPSEGDPGQVGVDPHTASTYNANLVRHVTSGMGTPLMPNRTFETYIFALFDEDLKPGPTFERHFGLFSPELVPVYDIGILRPNAESSNGGPITGPINAAPQGPNGNEMSWCVPKVDAKEADLQEIIDYVCGLGYDCKPIQSNGKCFIPNTVRAHAAFAMNLYYQANGRHDHNCNFRQSGAITSVDPSYGECKYHQENSSMV